MITEDMEDDALQAIAASEQRAAEDTVRTWLAIRDDFRKRGPFTAMLLEFRHAATEALAGLARCDPADTVTIRSLQADVQRFIATIEHIHAFRSSAEAWDANQSVELSLDEQAFIATLEDPGYADR